MLVNLISKIGEDGQPLSGVLVKPDSVQFIQYNNEVNEMAIGTSSGLVVKLPIICEDQVQTNLVKISAVVRSTLVK